MQREIKFKALIKISDALTHWDYYGIGTKPHLFGSAKWITEDLQFTGLLDKNGKEIYEGDVLRFDIIRDEEYDFPTFKAKIEYQYGGFWFVGIDYNLTDTNWHHYNPEDMEVIGNIYQEGEK